MTVFRRGRPLIREEAKQRLTIRVSPLLRQYLDSYEGEKPLSISEQIETHFRNTREFKTWLSRRQK